MTDAGFGKTPGQSMLHDHSHVTTTTGQVTISPLTVSNKRLVVPQQLEVDLGERIKSRNDTLTGAPLLVITFVKSENSSGIEQKGKFTIMSPSIDVVLKNANKALDLFRFLESKTIVVLRARDPITQK
jgi:hypothetical protein